VEYFRVFKQLFGRFVLISFRSSGGILRSRGKTLEDLILNAVITTTQEGETVAAGPTRIQGYAITGAGTPVERVELSVDGGKTMTIRLCRLEGFLYGSARRGCH
jgi:hypothetical protein